MASPKANIHSFWRAFGMALAFVLTGCAGATSADNSVSELDSMAQTSTIRSTTLRPSPITEAEDADMTEPQQTERPSDCVRLTDFDTEAEREAWQTVNDNVMGGRSSGGPSFGDGLMVFAGDTNTDGGGFSSLRLPLAPDALSEFERVVVRARSDGRQYMITFDDNVNSRDRRVSHRAPLPFETANDWQEVSVTFDELFPALFGRPVDDLPFDKTLATRMGIMISDGLDGAFRLEIDWIDLCA
jgi:monofunctional biosynthetic peptidoglycan transglycosylase